MMEYAPGWQGDYLWVVIVGFIVAFILSFSMGGNDCANSYGTAVGSNVLKLWQAYVMATVFETLGAGLLGYKVTDTLRKSIVSVSIYDVWALKTNGTYITLDPSECANYTGMEGAQLNYTFMNDTATEPCRHYTSVEFMLGALGSLAGCAVWLFVATVLKLPVSTTHSAVGATVGFSLVLRGAEGINWWTILKIVSSWVISPLMAGFFATVFYIIIKYAILNRDDPLEASLKALPIIFWFTLTTNLFSVMFHGSKYMHLDTVPWWWVALASFLIGATVAFVVWFFVVDRLRKWVLTKHSIVFPDDSRTYEGSVNRPPKEPRLRATDSIKSKSSVVKIETPLIPVTRRESCGPATVEAPTPMPVTRQESNVPLTVFDANDRNDRNTQTPELTKADESMQEDDSGIMITPGGYEGLSLKGYCNSSRHSPHIPDQKEYAGPITKLDMAPTNGYCSRAEGIKASSSILALPPALVDPKSLKNRLIALKHPVHEHPHVSRVFSSLQVMSACFMSFSHGSNDTANAIALLVAIWFMYQEGNAFGGDSSDGMLEVLILFGAVGMVLGLWCLGHKVIQTVGEDITKITPCSGFCMEVGTAFTVLLASKIGIPVSTTHCLVGAVVAVGWFKTRKGVSWKIFRNIALAWVVTLPVTAALAGLFAYLLLFTIPR